MADSFAHGLSRGLALANGPWGIGADRAPVGKTPHHSQPSGANIKIVSGYRGSTDIRLAMEREELDGVCDSMASAIPGRA